MTFSSPIYTLTEGKSWLVSPEAKDESEEVVLPRGRWRLCDACVCKKRGFQKELQKMTFTVQGLHADLHTEYPFNWHENHSNVQFIPLDSEWHLKVTSFQLTTGKKCSNVTHAKPRVKMTGTSRMWFFFFFLLFSLFRNHFLRSYSSPLHCRINVSYCFLLTY